MAWNVHEGTMQFYDNKCEVMIKIPILVCQSEEGVNKNYVTSFMNAPFADSSKKIVDGLPNGDAVEI